MATRYMVSWVGEGGKALCRGFAFQRGALDLWCELVNVEGRGKGLAAGASLAYLGPNGERSEQFEVSSTFSKVVGDGASPI